MSEFKAPSAKQIDYAHGLIEEIEARGADPETSHDYVDSLNRYEISVAIDDLRARRERARSRTRSPRSGKGRGHEDLPEESEKPAYIEALVYSWHKMWGPPGSYQLNLTESEYSLREYLALSWECYMKKVKDSQFPAEAYCFSLFGTLDSLLEEVAAAGHDLDEVRANSRLLDASARSRWSEPDRSANGPPHHDSDDLRSESDG